jgi:two-component system, OmpR family, KDP operon response regulator KdpE
MSGSTILVVDDEAQIRKFLRIALEANGFTVCEAATGGQGVARAATDTPDLVILDLGLPDLDGKEVIRRVREWSGVPILILSVRQAEAEKVAALDAGANDYVVKPFSVAELLARVRALLRTGSRQGVQQDEPAIFVVGDLAVDLARHEVHLGREPVKLTRKEFELLSVLARNAGRILTHGQLLREVWGKAHENDTQYLRVFVSQLRRKLNDDPASPRFILNEPGVGYRMLEPEV